MPKSDPTLAPWKPFELVELDDPKKLGAFCKGWRFDGRALQVEGLHASSYPWCREIFRSGDRIVIHACARGYDNPKVQCVRFPDEAAARRAFDGLCTKPPAGYVAYDPFYLPGKRGGTWVRDYGPSSGYVCGARVLAGKKFLPASAHGTREEAIAAFDAMEAKQMARGVFCHYLEIDKDIRPDDDIGLVKWMQDRERDDGQTASWQLDALPAIYAAMAVTGLPLGDVEVELGPAATSKELASYDASLPKPMTAELRALWTKTRSARWRVGNTTAQLLSPTEVIAERAKLRSGLAERIARLKKASQPQQWAAKELDVLIVQDGQGRAAFDVRQEVIPPGKAKDAQFFYMTDDDMMTMRTPVVYPVPLYYVLAESFASNFVDALVAKFPAIKKAKYGEPIARR